MDVSKEHTALNKPAKPSYERATTSAPATPPHMKGQPKVRSAREDNGGGYRNNQMDINRDGK
jgi:hypothetical protein